MALKANLFDLDSTLYEEGDVPHSVDHAFRRASDVPGVLVSLARRGGEPDEA